MLMWEMGFTFRWFTMIYGLLVWWDDSLNRPIALLKWVGVN